MFKAVLCSIGINPPQIHLRSFLSSCMVRAPLELSEGITFLNLTIFLESQRLWNQAIVYHSKDCKRHQSKIMLVWFLFFYSFLFRGDKKIFLLIIFLNFPTTFLSYVSFFFYFHIPCLLLSQGWGVSIVPWRRWKQEQEKEGRMEEEIGQNSPCLPLLAFPVSIAPRNSLVVCGTLVYGFVLLVFHSSTRWGSWVLWVSTIDTLPSFFNWGSCVLGYVLCMCVCERVFFAQFKRGRQPCDIKLRLLQTINFLFLLKHYTYW